MMASRVRPSPRSGPCLQIPRMAGDSKCCSLVGENSRKVRWMNGLQAHGLFDQIDHFLGPA